MISSQNDTAWVCEANGELVPFACEKLAKSIQQCAQLVGEEANDLAEAVAFAIYRFTCDRKDRNTIGRIEIVRIVESLLSLLGYEEIACTYAFENRLLLLRFDEILAHSEQHLELALYRHLDQVLEMAVENDLAQLRLEGLRPYVMLLRGVQRWSIGCQALANEIVEHIRDRMNHFSSDQHTMLQVVIIH